MNSDGTFTEVTLFGETVSGKSLMDKAEQLARDGYLAKNGSKDKDYGKDFLWCLWCGCYSPVYGKNKMTSFERYFIDDESTWVEIKDEYYHLIEKPSVCNKILCEFGIDPNNFSYDDFSKWAEEHNFNRIPHNDPLEAGYDWLPNEKGISKEVKKDKFVSKIT